MDRRRQDVLKCIQMAASAADRRFDEMARDLGLEVDHIIPLREENVSGLNVISNRRLISSHKNDSNHNNVRGPLIRRSVHEGSGGGQSVTTIAFDASQKYS